MKVEKVETVKTITLSLNGEEAGVLLRITQLIGGDPWASPRAVTDNLGQVLLEAGVTVPTDVKLQNKSNGIYFADYN